MTLRRQYGDSELVEAAQYAAPGETGCFFPPARYGSGDRLTDAPFTILKTSNLKHKVCHELVFSPVYFFLVV